MTDRIEKRILLKASVSRVWRAISDHREFGEWFRVKLEGPFVPGKSTRGNITYPGYEHLVWEAVIREVRPESLLSLEWHPYAIDTDIDYSGEDPTLVEFRLEPEGGGTLLTVTESGFERVPEHRRAEALKMNDGGWEEQMKNIQAYLETR